MEDQSIKKCLARIKAPGEWQEYNFEGEKRTSMLESIDLLFSAVHIQIEYELLKRENPSVKNEILDNTSGDNEENIFSQIKTMDHSELKDLKKEIEEAKSSIKKEGHQ